MDDRDNRGEREVRKTNWLSLLMLPLAFLVGWVANDALSNPGNTEGTPGVGGGPPSLTEEGTPTPTPSDGGNINIE